MATQRPYSMRLLATRPRKHVSYEIVKGVEDGICDALGWPRANPAARPMQLAAKASSALSLPRLIKSKRGLFMVSMGAYRIADYAADWRKTMGRRVVWLFDAWPSSYRFIGEVTKRYDIDLLFVTAKQSAERLDRALDGVEVKWCPEPLVDLGFKSAPFSGRKTGVVQFGRRYEAWHRAVLRSTTPIGAKYLYEDAPGQLVFPTRTEFLLGLADSKISVCFPCDVTNADRAGDVSTMTQRYLQSMASGCILLGEAPEEMIELMGYNPVVQADMNYPAAQVAEILANPEPYMDLVRRNLEEVKKHTIAVRSTFIAQQIG